MFETLKNLRVNVTLGAVLCVIFGIFCIGWPGKVVMTVTMIVGILFVIAGIVEFFTGILGEEKNITNIVLGIILLIVGIFVLTNKYQASKFFPIIIGIILIVSAIQDFSLVSAGKNASAPFWQGIILSAAIKLVLGMISILFAFKVVKYATVLLGIFLLLDGVASIFTVAKVNHAEGVFDSKINSETDL